MQPQPLRHIALRLAPWAASLLSGCQAAGETLGTSGAGSIFGVAALVLVGAGGIAIGTLRSRAAQAASERALRRELAASRCLLHGTHWRCDADLRITAVTPGASEHDLGLDAARWMGQPLIALLDDRAPPGSSALATLIAARAHIVSHPVSPRGPGAAIATMELSATPMSDDQGAFAGYIGLLHRPAAAPAAPPETSDAEDALSFSFTVSHDLRAPVRVVDGFARILKEDYGAQIDRVGNDHIDRVLGAAARMNQMIDALLAMARLSTQPLARQPVNLSQLAGFVVDDLRRGAPEREIIYDIDPDMQAQGDPTLLRQVLENLLGNAWKYTQRCHAPNVRFAIERLDGQRVFVVHDNGAGFDMRSVDRLFGLFQRLHSASEFPGTGVGLASVRRIIARHGGRIWAEGEPGKGATFRFTLRD